MPGVFCQFEAKSTRNFQLNLIYFFLLSILAIKLANDIVNRDGQDLDGVMWACLLNN
jgi:hypothetical protein